MKSSICSVIYDPPISKYRGFEPCSVPRNSGAPIFSSISQGLIRFEFAEYHSASARLQHAGDRDLGGITNVLAAIFDDYHCPVVEVANPLPSLFTRFNDFHFNRFTWQEDRFD